MNENQAIEAPSRVDALAQIDRVRPRRHWIWTLFANRTAVVGAVIVLVFTLVAIAAPVLAPKDPLDLDVLNKLKGPIGPHIRSEPPPVRPRRPLAV